MSVAVEYPSRAGDMMTVASAPALPEAARGVTPEVSPMHDESSTPPATVHGTTRCYRLGCRCDSCRAAKAVDARAHRAAHRDQEKARAAAYCAAHKLEHAAYLAAHKAEIAASRVAYNSAHKAERAAYQAAYYAAHCDEAAAYNSARKAKQISYHVAYRAAHRAERAAYKQERRARRLHALGKYGAADVRAQYERQHGRCFWCPKKVGKAYHVDHIVPLILGGSNGPENIVVACPTCNLSKGAKHPMDFVGRLC